MEEALAAGWARGEQRVRRRHHRGERAGIRNGRSTRTGGRVRGGGLGRARACTHVEGVPRARKVVTVERDLKGGGCVREERRGSDAQVIDPKGVARRVVGEREQREAPVRRGCPAGGERYVGEHGDVIVAHGHAARRDGDFEGHPRVRSHRDGRVARDHLATVREDSHVATMRPLHRP